MLRLVLEALFWGVLEKFHGLLRRMYICSKLGNIFCRCLLCPIDPQCYLTLKSLLSFSLETVYGDEVIQVTSYYVS